MFYMKKHLLISLFILPLCLHVFSQVQYYRTIKFGNQRTVVNAAVNTTNGFYVAGSADSMMYVLSANDSAVTQWAQLMNDNGSASATGMLINFNNKPVACGYMTQPTGNKVYCLMAFNQTGDTIKTTTLNDSLGDNFTGGMAQLKDSTYIVTGMGPSGLAVLHVTKSSNPISAKAYGAPLTNRNQKVVPLGNGGFVITCNNSATGGGNASSFRLLRFDNAANLAWAAEYTAPHGILANNLIITTDHQVLVCGQYTDSGIAGVSHNLMLLKINISGAVVWAKQYTGALLSNSSFNSIVQTADGGFAAYGSAGGVAYGGSDNLLLKTDSLGNIAWAKTYGLFSSDSGYCISAFKKGFALFGYGYDTTGSYIEAILTDTLGNTSCHYDSITLQQNTFTLTFDTFSLSSTILTGFGALQTNFSTGSTTTDTVCPAIIPTHFTYHHLLDSINIWHYAANICIVTPAMRNNNAKSLSSCGDPTLRGLLYSDADSVYNNTRYKQLNAVYNWPWYSGDTCFLGLIREDTISGAVYYLAAGHSSEILLYNFKMNIGDSLPISFVHAIGGRYWEDGLYTLHTIDTVSIISGPRKRYHLTCDTCQNSNELTWIEGVGNVADALYPYFKNESFACGPYTQLTGFQYHLDYFVTCYEHNQKVYFDDLPYNLAVNGQAGLTLIDSCDAIYNDGGITELSSLSSFTAFPNPANNKVTVQLNVAQSAGFDIYVKDITGKNTTNHVPLGRLNAGLHNADIDISNLSAGFYLLQCRTTAGSLYTKLVKQ